MPADGPARSSSSASSSSTSSSTASRESSDSMSMCRWAPSVARAAQEAAQAVGGVALPALRRVGAQQRGEGGDLDGQVRARERAGAVALELRAAPGQLARRGGDDVQRLRAAGGVALRLGLRDRHLAQQVDGAGDAVLPQVAQDAERRLRVLPDDEAVRHVADAGGRRRAERRAARARARHLQRHGHGRRRLLHLAEEAGQVAREVVERAAGGHDVDEAEQRRLELGVLRGELHRLGVRGLQAGGGRGAGGRPRAASPPRAARARGSRSPPCRRVYGRALDSGACASSDC